MVIVAPPRRRYQPDNNLLLSTLIQDTFICVRENVRLYNCCGLVTTVYFVVFRDYLGLYG